MLVTASGRGVAEVLLFEPADVDEVVVEEASNSVELGISWKVGSWREVWVDPIAPGYELGRLSLAADAAGTVEAPVTDDEFNGVLVGINPVLPVEPAVTDVEFDEVEVESDVRLGKGA